MSSVGLWRPVVPISASHQHDRAASAIWRNCACAFGATRMRSGTLRLDQSELGSPRRRGGARVHTQLIEDVLDMRLRRAFTYEKYFADLPVRASRVNELHHLELPGGELVGQTRLCFRRRLGICRGSPRHFALHELV